MIPPHEVTQQFVRLRRCLASATRRARDSAASAAVRRWPPRRRACGCSGTRPWTHVPCTRPGGQFVDLLGRGYLEVQLPSGVRPGGPGLRPSRQCPSARDPITPPGASRSPAERAGSFAAVSPTLGAAAGSPGVFASLRELEKGQGVPASRHVGSMCEKSLRSADFECDPLLPSAGEPSKFVV